MFTATAIIEKTISLLLRLIKLTSETADIWPLSNSHHQYDYPQLKIIPNFSRTPDPVLLANQQDGPARFSFIIFP